MGFDERDIFYTCVNGWWQSTHVQSTVLHLGLLLQWFLVGLVLSFLIVKGL